MLPPVEGKRFSIFPIKYRIVVSLARADLKTPEFKLVALQFKTKFQYNNGENQMDVKFFLRAYSQGDRNFQAAILHGVDLSNCNLSGIDLSRADLSGANLSGANLSRANVK